MLIVREQEAKGFRHRKERATESSGDSCLGMWHSGGVIESLHHSFPCFFTGIFLKHIYLLVTLKTEYFTVMCYFLINCLVQTSDLNSVGLTVYVSVFGLVS